MLRSNCWSLYVHIPFCRVRCTYCAFNIYTRRESTIPAYLTALGTELYWLSQSAHVAKTQTPLHTIYVGGGTPSLLDAVQIDALLQTCHTVFPVGAEAEITLEVNPDDNRDVTYFERIRASGVNRLSVGMQSVHADELRRFARRHDFAAVAQTIGAARQAGFTNISLDLIYGAPGQTLGSWRASLDAALSLEPDHLSLYALQVEPGTALARQIERGAWLAPDDDLAADMYDAAGERLPAAGLMHYEISTWARPGHECRHNLQYWHNEPYLGVGAGAHGYAAGVRYRVVNSLAAYITRATAQTAPASFPLTATTDECTPISRDQEMDETVMTGLRLTREGLNRAAFAARFGVSVEVVYAEAFARLAAFDMLDITPDRIRLRSGARLISNQILLHFMREPAEAISL
ncbi:MAG: radical SAM family heme chaperone HemW [Aggregatilineales bacterium]